MSSNTQASLSFAGQTWGCPLGRRLGEASGLWRTPFLGSHRTWGGLGLRGVRISAQISFHIDPASVLIQHDTTIVSSFWGPGPLSPGLFLWLQSAWRFGLWSMRISRASGTGTRRSLRHGARGRPWVSRGEIDLNWPLAEHTGDIIYIYILIIFCKY